MQVTRALVACGLFALLSASAFAECQVPDHRKGRLWLPGDSPVYTISIPITDFIPARLVCLAERLKQEHEHLKHFEVLIFSSHDAAMCYHGDVDIGDRAGEPASQREANCGYAPWSSHQLHGVYSHYADNNDGTYVLVSAFGGMLNLPGDTRINLPATTIPRCQFEVSNRCVISLDYPGPSGTYQFPSAGSVTLTARFSRRGIVQEINVAELRDMTRGSREAIVRAATDNLKTWRLEPAPREDTLRITYSQLIDPSLAPGAASAQFDIPRQITIRTRAAPRDTMLNRGALPFVVDAVPFAVRSIAFHGTPLIVGWCWLMWMRTPGGSAWRKWTLFAGLVAVSLNAVVFYAWVLYASGHHYSDASWQLGELLGNHLALPLVALAVVGTVAGVGRARLPLACSALMGLLLWIPATTFL